jgi:hypothetical protein
MPVGSPLYICRKARIRGYKRVLFRAKTSYGEFRFWAEKVPGGIRQRRRHGKDACSYVRSTLHIKTRGDKRPSRGRKAYCSRRRR